MSKDSNVILDINSSPKVDSFSSEDEKRITFWNNVYKKMPPTFHYMDSPTWKSNEKMYKGSSSGTKRKEETKTEL